MRLITIAVDSNDFWGDFTFRDQADLLRQFKAKVPGDDETEWFSLFVESRSSTPAKCAFIIAGNRSMVVEGGATLGKWLNDQKIPRG